jgi:regulator of RNase E activity RraA
MNILNSTSGDGELFSSARRELNSAVIGDVLDLMGFQQQFLPPQVQPLREDFVVCGRAMPVLEADDTGGEGSARKSDLLSRPFGLMLQALDDLRLNEVYVCTGASPRYALWGEMMSACAKNRGAVGAVVDGWSRDTTGILALNFPCFSHGRYAQDQRPRGKVVDFRCRIQIDGVVIRSGDVLFGDLEGVVVIPREVEGEVFEKARKKALGERRVFQAIQNGMGAQQAWEEFGIL